MSLDLFSMSLDPRVKTILGDLCFIGPVQHFSFYHVQHVIRPVQHFILPVQHVIRPVQHVIHQHVIDPRVKTCFWETSVSLDLSSMSLDLSSMSLDPRVKSIFGKPLFHWTCPAFHLWMTPVSIVTLGWNETFSLARAKNFWNRDPKHNGGTGFIQESRDHKTQRWGIKKRGQGRSGDTGLQTGKRPLATWTTRVTPHADVDSNGNRDPKNNVGIKNGVKNGGCKQKEPLERSILKGRGQRVHDTWKDCKKDAQKVYGTLGNKD
ncbi:hypothetical protein TNCV_2495971 [Trichonephila clavipes]|nr:hypothetical protein TNCV_2495971 [Trichonephila clavipes]